MTLTPTVLPMTNKLTSAGDTQLLIAAVLGIAAVVLLIVLVKLHPFVALMLGTAVMGAAAGCRPAGIVGNFVHGFSNTAGAVGLLIALGSMIAALLADSGGADTIVETIIARVGKRGLPWAMALIAAILGLPLFFEIGVVLLVPVVVLVARRTDSPLMRVGIPALAGLSILHGLVPPHPGPLVAINALHADIGLTLILGLVVAAPTLVICGPLLARVIETWVPVMAPAVVGGGGPGTEHPDQVQERADEREESSYAGDHRPSFLGAIISIALPVVLMLLRAIAELTMPTGSKPRETLEFLGYPTVALLLAVLVAMFFLGYRTGMGRDGVEKSMGGGLPTIAGILLIVAAGGGFKQLLVAAGVGNVIGHWASGSGISPLVLGWLVAVGVRVATGSATVATITASGIVTGIASGLPSGELSLLVLAVGCGSLFFSHVNDAGFWLVKEYFGLTVGQTLRSWSVMETAISVVGLAFVLLLNIVV